MMENKENINFYTEINYKALDKIHEQELIIEGLKKKYSTLEETNNILIEQNNILLEKNKLLLNKLKELK